jgi:putative transposase
MAMKMNRFTEEQIIRILKEQTAGKKVQELCREHGISDVTFYKWRSKYAGMQVNELKRLREMEAENGKLKRIVADLNLENYALKDLIEKKL